MKPVMAEKHAALPPTVDRPPKRTGLNRRSALSLLEGLLYLSPSLLLMGIFVFYPLVKSIRLSLYLTNPLGQEKVWVGLSQYKEIFQTGNFGSSLITTLLFTIYTVLPGIAVALLLAVIANWKLKGIGFFRTVFAIPIVVAVASASMMLYNPSSGVLNYLLGKVGGSPIKWLVDPGWALISVAMVNMWRNLGFNTIILLSGLQSIPEELYESGRIDGAGPWHLFRHITIPMLSPTLFFLLIVSVIGALQTFGEINVLTQGGPVGATNVIVYSIYREAFFNFRFGFASAQSMVLFLIILVLTLLQFYFLERRVFCQ